MKKILLIASLLSATAFAADLPDPVRTPGVTNPDVTQANINKTICVPHWTETIRPPVSYTNKLKLKQMKELGLTGHPLDYEEDHLISLQLGGHPKDPKNLWPQEWDADWGAHRKDVIETRLKRMVCTGQITLAEAQHAIATDWVATYKKYIPIKN
jgi:hypothetical protein